MSLFGPKIVNCPKGIWTTLISNFGTGMPKFFNITFTTNGDAAIDGEFIEKRALWIFPQAEVRGRLTPKMEFHRFWINAIYSVRVCPTVDVVATVE